MSDTIYLYLKTHNKTGLKYLGKTIHDDVDSYKGSGIRWTNHIKKHGYDVTTEILFQSDDKNEFSEFASFLSEELDIVNSNEFANLCPEQGQGGTTVDSPERREKISKALKGRKNTWIKKGINSGNVSAVDTLTGETVRVSLEEFKSNRYVGVAIKNKNKKYAKRKPYKRTNSIVTCPHCGKEGAKNNMTRYHFDNCQSPS
jgi:hypothetical protein